MRKPDAGGMGFVNDSYKITRDEHGNVILEEGDVKTVEGWHGTGSFDASNIYL